MKLNFNAKDVAPATSTEILEPGYYLGTITNSEDVGQNTIAFACYLRCKPIGRARGMRIDLADCRDKAVLSSVCRAAGVEILTDTEQLHYIQMWFYVDKKYCSTTGHYNQITHAVAYTPATQQVMLLGEHK